MPPQPDLSKPTVAILNGLINPIPPIKGGGPQIVIWNTCQFLANACFDWRVLTLYDPELGDSTAENERIIQVKINKFERFILRIIKHFPDRIVKGFFGVIRQDHLGLNLAMISALRKVKPDLIVVHESYSLTYLCHQFYPRTHVVLYYHSCKLHQDLTEPRWKRLLKSASSGIVTICQEAINLASKTFREMPKKSWTILNAVSPDLYLFSGDKDKLRQKFSLPVDSKIFIYSGRIHPQKGLELLIDKVNQVSTQTDDSIVLLILGSAKTDEDGSMAFEQKLKQQVKSSPAQIRFLGFVPNEQLAEYYALSDYGVLPTKLLEGNSLFLMECLTFGLPVIATRKGGIPEVVREGKDGVLLDEDKLEAELAPTLLKFIEEHELWESRRSEIAKSAAERFSYERVAHEFVQVVQDILKPKAIA